MKTTNIPAKWRAYHHQLLVVRDRLLQERKTLLAEVAEPLERSSMHLADAASDQAEHDLALANTSAEQDALYEIDQALKRIEAGTYGVCELTGKPIPPARLRVIPWARFSQEAESRLENEHTVDHTRLGALHSVRELEKPR